MNDPSEIAKALRLCQFGECGCGKCYYKELKGDWCTEDNHPEFFDCDDKLKLDAADAIEALQAEVAFYKKRVCESCGVCLDDMSDPNNCEIAGHGMWVGVNPLVDSVQCSICAGCFTAKNLKRRIAHIAGRRWRCRMGRNKECQYITEDEVWERFVIVRRMWMKYNRLEPQEVQE